MVNAERGGSNQERVALRREITALTTEHSRLSTTAETLQKGIDMRREAATRARRIEAENHVLTGTLRDERARLQVLSDLPGAALQKDVQDAEKVNADLVSEKGAIERRNSDIARRIASARKSAKDRVRKAAGTVFFVGGVIMYALGLSGTNTIFYSHSDQNMPAVSSYVISGATTEGKTENRDVKTAQLNGVAKTVPHTYISTLDEDYIGVGLAAIGNVLFFKISGLQEMFFGRRRKNENRSSN